MGVKRFIFDRASMSMSIVSCMSPVYVMRGYGGENSIIGSKGGSEKMRGADPSGSVSHSCRLISDTAVELLRDVSRDGS
jgi:hypothetical protein